MRDRGKELATYARITEMDLTPVECQSVLAMLWVVDPDLVAHMLNVVQTQRDRSGS